MATQLNFGSLVTYPDNTRQLATYNNLKNRIINGKMQIDQLGGGVVTYPASGYSSYMCMFTIDRWIYSSVGTATYAANVEQVVVGTGQYAKTALKFSANTAAAAGYPSNYSGFAQRIESIYTQDLANSKVTISANISLAFGATVYWSLYYPNSKDSYSQRPVDYYNDQVLGRPDTPSQNYPVYGNCTQITNGSFIATTTPSTYYFTTGNLPFEVRNGLMLYFYVATGSLSPQSFILTDVSLEKGPYGPTNSPGPWASLPSPSDNRSAQKELELCRRYLYCQGYTTSATSERATYTLENVETSMRTEANGNGLTETYVNTFWKFPTPMFSSRDLTGSSSNNLRFVTMSWPWVTTSSTYAPVRLTAKCGFGTGDNWNPGWYGPAYEMLLPLSNWMYFSDTIFRQGVETGTTYNYIGCRLKFGGSTITSGTKPPYISPTLVYQVGDFYSTKVTRNAIGFRSEL